MADDFPQKARNEMYWRLFKSELGKEVLADMRRRAYCERTTFVRLPNGDVDVQTMLTREGARDFVQTTCDWIKAAERPKPERQKKALTETVQDA